MKKKLITSLIIFIICSCFHFGYSIFPNKITALLFPVNESIWEHFKLIFISTIFYSLIKYFKNGETSFLKILLRSIISILILALLFIPSFYFIGENIIITFIMLYISIFISEILIDNISSSNIQDIISMILIILIYISFVYLTFNPVKTGIFYDYNSNHYGIKK